jgi:ABC-type polysaccharide/polyol phosphate transport system ATPase subunit
MSASPSSLIELKNVSLIYELYRDRSNTFKEWAINRLLKRDWSLETDRTIHALNKISLRIEHGERVGVIGANGSGKSSLLKVISGVLKPSRGQVKVAGAIQPLIEIGAGFNPEFSGRDNIYLNGYMLGFTRQQIRAKEEEIIAFTELGRFIDVPVKYYSSGMSVRLAFTIATMIDPEILVFDEMLAAGDAEFMEKARRRMDQLITSAKMLVLVTHDLGLVRAVTRRTLVMDEGRIVFDGETEEAIDFYRDQVAGNLADKGADLDLRDRERDDAKIRISRGSGPLRPTPAEFLPDQPLEFSLAFELLEDFDELFTNLEVYDRTGALVCHLRNDFVGVRFRGAGKGKYQLAIPMNELPLRSDIYQFYFRIVGRQGGAEIIEDSRRGSFRVLGSLSAHRFIRHEWRLERS